jgi:hypothetical protein
MPFRRCTPSQRPFAINAFLVWKGSPPSSVTCGTLPGAGGTLPSSGLFLPRAVPLLPVAARTLRAVFRPLLTPFAHGHRAPDSLAVSTTHSGCPGATRLRQAVRRWHGLLRAPTRSPVVSGESRRAAAQPRRRRAGPPSCRAARRRRPAQSPPTPSHSGAVKRPGGPRQGTHMAVAPGRAHCLRRS